MLKNSNYKKIHKSGVSLIIAIIFVSAFLLVLAGLAQSQLSTIQAIANRETEAKVRYLAQSAEELAQFFIATRGPGWNLEESSGSVPNDIERKIWEAAATTLGISSCNLNNPNPNAIIPCARVRVTGRSSVAVQIAGSGSSYYSAPAAYSAGGAIKGTGDAASTGEACTSNAFDACHWNKLYVGQAVEVPLSYDDGSQVIKPSFNQWILRIRTPCDNLASNCPPQNRIKLYPRVTEDPTQPFRNVRDPTPNDNYYDVDPVLVQWLITDMDGRETLFANDVKDQTGSRLLPNTLDNIKRNTELSAGRINDANPITSPLFILGNSIQPYIVLERDHLGKKIDNLPQSIVNFLNRQDISRPVLRLNLVSRPKRDIPLNETHMSSQQLNDTSMDVPYVEYQLLTNVSIADSKSILSGWVQIGDFLKTFQTYKKIPESLSGFVLESF